MIISGKKFNDNNDIILIKFIPFMNPESGYIQSFTNTSDLYYEDGLYVIKLNEEYKEYRNREYDKKNKYYKGDNNSHKKYPLMNRYLYREQIMDIIDSWGSFGYKFKTNGLNILQNTFNNIIGNNGFHFCTALDASKWKHCGDIIKMVTIPDDAKVVKEDNVIKADKIILGPLDEKYAINLVIEDISLFFKIREKYVNEIFCSKIFEKNKNFKDKIITTGYYRKTLDYYSKPFIDKYISEKKTCFITGEQINKLNIGVLYCGHVFNGLSINYYLKDNNKCPICKKIAFLTYYNFSKEVIDK